MRSSKGSGTAKDYDTRDRTSRHSDDALLRRHRFTIHARPKGRMAVWQRDGQLYTEAEAHRLIEAHDAVFTEEDRSGG